MENTYEILYIPAIAVIVYIIMSIYKKAIGDKSELLIGLIPLFSCLIGGVIGALTFCSSPEIIPADNVLLAIIIGMASGLTATGVNQCGKQLKRLSDVTKTATNPTTSTIIVKDESETKDETKSS